MKKVFLMVFIVCFCSIAQRAISEQYLLDCKIDVEATNTSTGEVMKKFPIQRYFVIDTVLAQVYDANNLPLDVEDFDEDMIVFHKKAANMNNIVDTQFHYSRGTNKITLSEIYANNVNDTLPRFNTRGAGSCSEKEIERKLNPGVWF